MKNESSIKVMKELVDIIAKLNERIEELEAVKPQHPNPALENVLAKLRDFYNCCVKDAHDKDAILVDIGAQHDY